MFTVPSFMRSRSLLRPASRKPHPRVAIEVLEDRRFFAFNAYIAGLASGATDSNASFVFSTTGQAAKQWAINWGDGSSPETQSAPNQITGFTTPQTFTHLYGSQGGSFAVTATSITNVTATAVPLAENSAFGTTALDQNGNPVRTGKTVQGLNDSNSAGTNISTVVDENNNTYVLSIDGKRFGITVHGC